MKTTEDTHVRKALHDGVWLNVDISNVAEWNVYIKGGHDLGVMYWIRTLGRKDTTLVDIGANVGLMTIPMANATGDGGRVIAYEPYPESYARLRENCREAGIENTELRNVAIGEVAGEMQLHVPKNKGAATLIARDDAQAVTVSVERPADLGEDVSVVKIDVEGFESNVLLAIEKVITKTRPALIVETTFDSRALEYLVNIGYELREVINHPPFSRPVRERDGKQIEILALPKELDLLGSAKTTLAECSRTAEA